MSLITEFDHLKIPLQHIKSATNDFGETSVIGRGGFGKVYKAQLLLSELGLTTVAIKRLDSALGQGAPEFWKEIMMLSHCKHKNIVSLLGFCDENDEKILVYEYLSNKSLDKYLSSTDLSWNQRLRICIGVARGLRYLHDSQGTQQRVLHRDIKSGNILLDKNWNAKISDFGLSKFGPANQQYTFIVSHVVGTIGYVDPLYVEADFLTKEVDVYSFGVVLFEVLCGRLGVQIYEGTRHFLATLAQQCYEEKKLDTIIECSLKEQISPECLETFSTIAYQCLQKNHKERPSMAKIVKELMSARQHQVEYEFEKKKKLWEHMVESDEYWEMKLPRDWKAILKMLNIPRDIYTTKKELFSFLHEGSLFDQHNKFFWINNDGKKCILISARRFLDDKAIYPTWVFQPDSRFSMVALYPHRECHDIKCQIKASKLSPGTMYAASMVFKCHGQSFEDLKRLRLITIKWKTEGLSVYSIHTAELTPQNWYKIKMWHFINHVSDADFDIVIKELSYFEDPDKSRFDLLIQGIEFQPLEIMQRGEIGGYDGPSTSEEENKDEDWEKKLPNNYQYFVQRSDMHLTYTSKKELYSLLCAGFLGYNGGLWFSLCKSTSGICSMLPASEILRQHYDYKNLDTLSLSESRFGGVKKLQDTYWCRFTCELQSPIFSPHHIYACYLVFKFADKNIRLDDTRLLEADYILDGHHRGTNIVHLNLLQPMSIPTIKPKNDHGSHASSNKLRIERLGMPKYRMHHAIDGWVEQRKDGWMEVILCKSLHQLQDHESLEVKLRPRGGGVYGIIVEGIEFRPMQD